LSGSSIVQVYQNHILSQPRELSDFVKMASWQT
jgi:hypothetical protein